MGKLIKNNFLVVSDYNWLPEKIEDSWVHQYTDNYLIYDKYHRFEESDKVKHQKNVGQNIYDIFDFIYTHYENLPENTIFCRAVIMRPKDQGLGTKGNGNCSKETFDRLMNNESFTELHDFGPEVHTTNASKYGPGGSFLEINNSWYLHYHRPKYFQSLNDFLNDVYVNPEIPSYIRFAPGGNYIIPKKNMLRYSKKFYELMREYIGWDKITGEAHLVERALYTIFTCDYEIKDKYK